MKKKIALLMVAVLSVASLAVACGSSDEEETTTKETTTTTAAEDTTEEDTTTVAEEAAELAAGDTVGSTTAGFWTDLTNTLQIEEGKTATVTYTIESDSAARYHTGVLVLQNVAQEANAANPDGYAEYAVIRNDFFGTINDADVTGSNFAWGGTVLTDSTWTEGLTYTGMDLDSDAYMAIVNGATVTVTVTNNGDTADMTIKTVSADGTEYTGSLTGVVTGGDLYIRFTVECAALTFTEVSVA